jgi:acyl carrier protein phosphodiesterase
MDATTLRVNFFGHAAVASWHDERAGVALGAMLPDFATMCHARLAPPDDAALADGVSLHHRTDAAFHTLPAVLGLMRELDEILAHGGCARGPRRAVAHIGVELLLDGVLVDDTAYRDAYTAGLAADVTGVRWRDDDAPPRFAILIARLRDRGVPDDLRDPEAIAMRLHRMLAHRPLLAPNGEDMRVVRSALGEYRHRVEVAADTVLRGVRTRLSAG